MTSVEETLQRSRKGNQVASRETVIKLLYLACNIALALSGIGREKERNEIKENRLTDLLTAL